MMMEIWILFSASYEGTIPLFGLKVMELIILVGRKKYCDNRLDAAADVFAADIDGDGDLDILVSASVNDDKLPGMKMMVLPIQTLQAVDRINYCR